MMTRKDFQELADIVNKAGHLQMIGEPWTVGEWAKVLAMMCKRSNPAFKRDVFYRACGLPEMADN